MKYEVDYEIAPPQGSVVLFDGHPFTLLGFEAYVRTNGQSSSLIKWRTTCVRCGVPVDVTTGFRSKTITKRCAEHRRRGVPATPGAKARLEKNNSKKAK